MYKMLKKILSLALTLLTVASLCTGVLANEVSKVVAEKTITFETVNKTYTASDLFDNFKNVMPGDTLTQTITFENKTNADSDLTLTLTGVPHGENNAIHDAVANTWKDKEDVLTEMDEFLSQMTLTIYKGEDTNGTPLVDELPANEILDKITLAGIGKGESVILTVVLHVSIEMGNEFQNRAGEIDWNFAAEGFNYSTIQVQKYWEDGGYNRPKSIKVYLLKDGERTDEYITLTAKTNWAGKFDNLDDRYTWTVEEVVPAGYDEPTYSQKDNVIFITNKRNTPWIPPFPPETEPPETQPPETRPPETEPDETEPETKPVETEPEETEPPVIEEPAVRDLTVVKNWAEDKAEDRPTSVSVSLYKGDTEVEKVTLGDWNNWSYTWYDLDANEQWSVLEVEIPLGYTPTYAADGDTVTITNNAILIQTGQLNWPIPVFGGIGVLLIGAGVLLLRKKKENHNA